jgi:four helix bundle protein
MRESPFFVKLFAFVAWLIPLTTKFPRSQRFVVAERLQRAILATQEAAISAGHAKTPTQIAEHLDAVALQLSITRFYLRLAHQLTFITMQHYEHASQRLTEIGRLLEAWRRSNLANMAVPSGAAD